MKDNLRAGGTHAFSEAMAEASLGVGSHESNHRIGRSSAQNTDFFDIFPGMRRPSASEFDATCVFRPQARVGCRSGPHAYVHGPPYFYARRPHLCYGKEESKLCAPDETPFQGQRA